MLILGVGLLVGGFILIVLSAVFATSSVLPPWSPSIGLAFLALVAFWFGAVVTIIGIPVTVYGIIAEPKPSAAPKVKAERRKIVHVAEETGEDNLGFITSIVTGIVFIVVGIMSKLLTINADSKVTITIGTLALIVFVVIGMLIISFGVVDYIAAKKRK